MTEQEAYQEHIRYTHDTYCRIVIRHASFDAARMLAARWKREISLEYLTEEKFVPLSTTDEYFQVPDYGETYPFSVRGRPHVLLLSCHRGEVGYSWDSTSITSFSRFKASWICRPIVLRVQPLCSPISFCVKCWK